MGESVALLSRRLCGHCAFDSDLGTSRTREEGEPATVRPYQDAACSDVQYSAAQRSAVQCSPAQSKVCGSRGWHRFNSLLYCTVLNVRPKPCATLSAATSMHLASYEVSAR